VEDDAFAFAPAQRDGSSRRDTHRLEECIVFLLDPLKHSLVVSNQVHFVDSHYHLLDAQHTEQIAMPARIFAHAFMRIDDQHSCFSMRSTRDHILDKFNVPRCIQDEILAHFRFEKDAGSINGDVLCAFVFERIDKISVLKWHTAAGAIGLQRF